ncbi:hypothetical protein XELAEV_18029554mg [Xenopus laevis]|uniref:Uncharacterized protein n=1 Tax=Xenopus laevis TaxID=8355 RepID=A0A974CRU5_XENLA|nr:hypothetical protein XELAEV_18029554mg [Xenopus laevis]
MGKLIVLGDAEMLETLCLSHAIGSAVVKTLKEPHTPYIMQAGSLPLHCANNFHNNYIVKSNVFLNSYYCSVKFTEE